MQESTGAARARRKSLHQANNPERLCKYRGINEASWTMKCVLSCIPEPMVVMAARALCMLGLVLALASSSSAEYVGLSANQCAVPAKDRVDCGYPQVTHEQCNNRGCCFDSSIPEVPWCFKPLQEQGVNTSTLPYPLPDSFLLCP
ncbi:LOW QUALITY PROTEIN: trefoil factor 3 [Piliocolobus tephrosceles]|uniref:LOW QUALITY PROTEIN: trefoil factor 3 n=1 Tax=Piliocolobus tephrosceles TaxID=591936 RepID=UPI000C2B0326|nr:LOW QUALITY PROTEIN: trefoil factor 3 [Piliocolobus tephrosceles]